MIINMLNCIKFYKTTNINLTTDTFTGALRKFSNRSNDGETLLMGLVKLVLKQTSDDSVLIVSFFVVATCKVTFYHELYVHEHIIKRRYLYSQLLMRFLKLYCHPAKNHFLFVYLRSSRTTLFSGILTTS